MLGGGPKPGFAACNTLSGGSVHGSIQKLKLAFWMVCNGFLEFPRILLPMNFFGDSRHLIIAAAQRVAIRRRACSYPRRCCRFVPSGSGESAFLVCQFPHVSWTPSPSMHPVRAGADELPKAAFGDGLVESERAILTESRRGVAERRYRPFPCHSFGASSPSWFLGFLEV